MIRSTLSAALVALTVLAAMLLRPERPLRHGTGFTSVTPATWYPLVVSLVLAGGHEIGHHGYLHLRSDKVDERAQRDEIERGLAALAKAGTPRPRGYRSTSWELTPEN